MKTVIIVYNNAIPAHLVRVVWHCCPRDAGEDPTAAASSPYHLCFGLWLEGLIPLCTGESWVMCQDCSCVPSGTAIFISSYAAWTRVRRLKHNRVIQDYNEYTSGVHSSMRKPHSHWLVSLQWQRFILSVSGCSFTVWLLPEGLWIQ